ncbi:hypothetical protein D2962_08255 [Biomaibacter acetigenes]|uniref:Uncharacterized protein n=1 Tax=Biomaibacter acetigenes TaxID=2316383 RepID=A0A3G2R5J3_9FIRM|nr:hypothetical protein [Biomaibacter acetigenes]AYO30615.1 hypothetical protein D2962_08255 [Biomaibacter acetigenes]
MITIYEYICYTNPYIIFKLKRAGLLAKNEAAEAVISISRKEIIELMKHDHYKRIGRYLRQIHPGRVVG